MPKWLRRMVRSGERVSPFSFAASAFSASRNSGVSSTRVWMNQASPRTRKPTKNGTRQPQAANVESLVTAPATRKTVLAVTTPMGTPSCTRLP